MNPTIKILGIGTAAPRYSMDQMEAAEMVRAFSVDSPEMERLVPLIYQKSSVQQRGLIVLEKNGRTLKPCKVFSKIKHSQDQGPSTEERMEIYKKEAPLLAIEASQKAILESEIEVHEIDHLITVSCTGFFAPGFDVTLIKELNLCHSVSRTHIGFMGCHGMFNGLRIARALTSQAVPSTALVTAVELCSIHVAYGSDPSRLVANALFADGSSSAVISGKESSKSKWKLAVNGSYLFPNSENLMQWEIGNNGFVMSLSHEVPNMIEMYLKEFISKWLNENGLDLSAIRSWAVHPGGPKILTAVESALNLKSGALNISRQILTHYGNMSSATILYIVDELIKNGAETPCVALGFGPGLHLEIALFV